MKKKIMIGIVIAVLLMLLISIPMQLKDGGSVQYSALLYKVTNWKMQELTDVFVLTTAI